MKANLLRDIGENSEYLKEIVSNTLELKKIEALEASGEILSQILLSIVLGAIAFIASFLAVVLLIILLAKSLMSYPLAILTTMGILALIAILTYFLRHQLIEKPTMKFIHNQILKNL